ncbi:VOC family protein [Mesobacterium pallidum]|uniref:VOC family protein n=1 Tax=Mesobacterium pallidum TaxID=2872037 RepID=UPI001EE39FC4|nr:VOC family protein [Mesobacterium pallidum]
MILPYIHFQGQCRAALTFYAEVLGGTPEMMSYAQMPDAPEAFANSTRILHGQLATDGHGTLMASDFPEGFEGDPQKAVSITITTETADEARRLYDAFADGGDPIQPFAATFFSPGFGMIRDRFGTHWMVMAGGAT